MRKARLPGHWQREGRVFISPATHPVLLALPSPCCGTQLYCSSSDRGCTVLRAPCPEVTGGTDTNRELVVCLCCVSQGWKLLPLELFCSTAVFQHPQDSARKREKCIVCNHHQNPGVSVILKNYTFHQMIYFIVRMPSNKEMITFLLQLSPICQPLGAAAQAHTPACQPSSLLPPLQTWKRSKEDKWAQQLCLSDCFSVSIWEVREGQRKRSPYKWIVVGSTCAVSASSSWAFCFSGEKFLKVIGKLSLQGQSFSCEGAKWYLPIFEDRVLKIP